MRRSWSKGDGPNMSGYTRRVTSDDTQDHMHTLIPELEMKGAERTIHVQLPEVISSNALWTSIASSMISISVNIKFVLLEVSTSKDMTGVF